MSQPTGVDKMKAFARQQPLRTLAESLRVLSGRSGQLNEYERLTRAVLIDVICEKCPAADAAFGAWAESDDDSIGNADEAILAAAFAA